MEEIALGGGMGNYPGGWSQALCQQKVELISRMKLAASSDRMSK